MTREELVGIINDECYVESSEPIKGLKQAADRILAAIEKEREEEYKHDQLLIYGDWDTLALSDLRVEIFLTTGDDLKGKTGQLIFRPTKGA